eukprot:scaffold8462_cov110-Isochrysis_galbana.AAC.5
MHPWRWVNLYSTVHLQLSTPSRRLVSRESGLAERRACVRCANMVVHTGTQSAPRTCTRPAATSGRLNVAPTCRRLPRVHLKNCTADEAACGPPEPRVSFRLLVLVPADADSDADGRRHVPRHDTKQQRVEGRVAVDVDRRLDGRQREELDDGLLGRRVGWEARVEQLLEAGQLVDGGVFLEHGLLVGEGEEGAAAVVRAHAGGADAAEGQVVVGQVHQAVVDAESARSGARADGMGDAVVPGEGVEGEGLTRRQLLDEPQDVLQVSVPRAGQDGAEDLILGKGVGWPVGEGVGKRGWPVGEGGRVGAASRPERESGVGEEASKVGARGWGSRWKGPARRARRVRACMASLALKARRSRP